MRKNLILIVMLWAAGDPERGGSVAPCHASSSGSLGGPPARAPSAVGERGSLFGGVAAAPAPPSPGLPALPGEPRGALGPVTRFAPGASSGAPRAVQSVR